MKLQVLAGVLILFGPVCLGQQLGSPPKALDKAGFEDFLKKVQAAAELWDKDDPNDLLADAHKTVAYTSQSAALFKDAASGLRAGAAVFVAAKLLAPLLNSNTETIRQALPIVKSLHGRLGRYKKLPTYPAGLLRALKLPDKPPRGSAERNLKALAQFSERRHKKIQAEAKVIRYNVQAVELERICIRLLLKVKQPSEDQRVVGHLAQLEKKGDSTYQNVVEAIKLEAATMSLDRAGMLYDSLLELGTRLALVESNYVNPTDARIYTDQNSVFARPRCQPGLDILGAVNALAPVAQKPKVKLPDKAEVTATSQLNYIKARLRSGRSYSSKTAQRDLRTIISRYPRTNAAKKARALLSELRRSR